VDEIEVVGNVGEDYKPGVSLYGLICFIYGQHAIHLKDMEQSARRDAICHSLAKFYDSQEALKVCLLISQMLKYKSKYDMLSRNAHLSLFNGNNKISGYPLSWAVASLG
jgi:hypothetical protein